MPVVYYSLDHEFAAASGSNVNIDPDYSYFDHPPNSTANLTISSNKGDDDPSLFEIGDTYDLEWTGHGGGSMDDAVVIRSDYLAPGDGAIVFEGINDNTGETYQVIWTPGFDLENWYWSNGGGPSSPNAFWTSDQDAATTVQYVCFARGTRIRTPRGYRRVERLAVGDMVETLDHGAQPLEWIGSRWVGGRGALAPVVFAPHAIGNQKTLVLSQNHRVVLASRFARKRFGSREVFVPAKALVNGHSIRIEPRVRVQYFHLLLARHEVLKAEGADCESLFVGKVSAAFLDGVEDALAGQVGLDPKTRFRNMELARPSASYRRGRSLAQKLGIVGQRPQARGSLGGEGAGGR